MNFKVGACYGLQVSGTTMGSFRIYNGKVTTETQTSITLKYMGSNGQVRTRNIKKLDIIKAVKL
ncbi:hypothetical protein [Tumebacillus sp. BK434]|uniref:hypothetical protein n=1 Tax=Tumebacillus sp. BK434 TaxID=2512169 RepID=UPI001043789D|nr:hypothetical protein [Tumebacillus sp. BK434]